MLIFLKKERPFSIRAGRAEDSGALARAALSHARSSLPAFPRCYRLPTVCSLNAVGNREHENKLHTRSG